VDSGVDNIVLLAQTMRLKRSSGYRRQCHECFKMYVKPSNGFCYACSPEFEQLLVVERNDINVAISRLIKDDGYKALMKEWHSRENEGTYDHPVDPRDCTNRQKRLILYYKAFNWFYSGAIRPDPSLHEVLTLCFRSKLRKKYPDDDRDRAVQEAVEMKFKNGAFVMQDYLETVVDRYQPNRQVETMEGYTPGSVTGATEYDTIYGKQ